MPLPRPLPEPGPVLTYLSKIGAINPALRDKTIGDIRALLAYPEGAILLELLEVSTSLSLLPTLADERALLARNAQAILASDLRRIMSDEHEQVLERSSAQRTRRTGRG